MGVPINTMKISIVSLLNLFKEAKIQISFTVNGEISAHMEKSDINMVSLAHEQHHGLDNPTIQQLLTKNYENNVSRSDKSYMVKYYINTKLI